MPLLQVSFACQSDFKRNLPLWAVSKIAIDELVHLHEMRIYCDRSATIDQHSRLATVEMIRKSEDASSSEETAQITRGQQKFAKFKQTLKKKVALKKEFPTLNVELALDEVQAKNKIWVRSEAVVRTSKEELLAFFWQFDARCRRGEGDIERRVVEKESAHSVVGYV